MTKMLRSHVASTRRVIIPAETELTLKSFRRTGCLCQRCFARFVVPLHLSFEFRGGSIVNNHVVVVYLKCEIFPYTTFSLLCLLNECSLQLLLSLLYVLHVYLFLRHLHAVHVNTDCNRCYAIRRVLPPSVPEEQYRQYRFLSSYRFFRFLKSDYRWFFFHHITVSNGVVSIGSHDISTVWSMQFI